ncbi:60S large subunit ribosomal protein eL31 (rpL31) [Andalucia godoyi]|uniref:60S large subunit ribosomal protein eL31 (RpL31) n=1 Tax=Andalucia godoyi TaxID=505711 RepID=A0A8K0F4C9_ANDGO|nr:60S large subunit ribosomal protein eL31 (rpL31) [Andalucia godoyi]|eukprot:ANDGO_07675.mRNA.1 60S large subunit ribosomal protein eL31 (rpL31)
MAPTTDKKHPRSSFEAVTREYTVNLHKRVFKESFKKRAKTAMKQIKEFARATMRTEEVHVEPTLNKAVWARGVKNPPTRIRVRIARRRSEDEDAKNAWYCVVSYVPVDDFKGLVNTTVPNAE